jgi:hypothetical protein
MINVSITIYTKGIPHTIYRAVDAWTLRKLRNLHGYHNVKEV